jgi:spore germination protein
VLIHVVSKGETLWQISNRYGVSVAEIATINELPNPNQLVIGQALVIPAKDITHIVRPGETLWRIAQRYGVSLQELIEVNRIENPNLIYPGIILIIPGKPRPPIDVNGYIYFLGEDAVPIIEDVGRYLTYLSPFAYLIKENGDLQPINDSPAVRVAKAKNAIPMMAITNFTSTATGANLAHIVLGSPQIVERLLDNIINTMKSKGYSGLNVDFENVLPADRELYNSFLRRAVERLHNEGYFVSTAVAPKVSATQPGELYEAHDYEAHGRIVDFVILMTYEWGYRKGPPQAISPLNQIIRVLNYAITAIPREKIFFGFQIYARDWRLPFVYGQEAETFSPQEAILRAVRYGATIQYDQVAQSPFYRYTDEREIRHEVWFEDARSAQAKFDTVKNYRLKGISYWALGYPFPQNWVLLEDNFIIRKGL